MLKDVKKKAEKDPDENLKREGRIGRKKLMDIGRLKAKERYGPDQTAQHKYMELMLKMFKNDEARFSIDILPQAELGNAGSILEEYTLFTTVQVFSQRCTPVHLKKYEDHVLFAEK